MTQPNKTVEAVARAIYEYAPAMHQTQFSGREPWSWGDICAYYPRFADDYRAKARVAISAMPANGMVGELVEALAPFALAADDLDDEHGDNSELWEAPAAMAITAGDLRHARAIIAKAKGAGG